MSGALGENNTGPCCPTTDLMHKYGLTVSKMVQGQSADPMEVTLLLVLHLCILNDLERSTSDRDKCELRRLAHAGGPLFLSPAYRTVFLKKPAIVAKFKWTNKEYGLVRFSFDRNVNKWNLLVKSFKADKLL